MGEKEERYKIIAINLRNTWVPRSSSWSHHLDDLISRASEEQIFSLQQLEQYLLEPTAQVVELQKGELEERDVTFLSLMLVEMCVVLTMMQREKKYI